MTKFKKIWLYSVIFIIAVVAAISMNVNANQYGLTDMKLANIEVLATREGPDDVACYYIDSPIFGEVVGLGEDEYLWDERWVCGEHVGYPCLGYMWSYFYPSPWTGYCDPSPSPNP